MGACLENLRPARNLDFQEIEKVVNFWAFSVGDLTAVIATMPRTKTPTESTAPAKTASGRDGKWRG